VEIPRLKAYGVEIPEIEEKRKEINETTRELRMAETRVHQLEGQRENARFQDTRQGLKAKRRGKRDPGTKHQDKLEGEIAAAKRECEILSALLAELEGETRDLVTEHSHTILEGLRAAQRELDQEQLKALETLSTTRATRQGLQQSLDKVAAVAEAPPSPEPQGPGRDMIFVMRHSLYRPPNDQEIAEALASSRLSRSSTIPSPISSTHREAACRRGEGRSTQKPGARPSARRQRLEADEQSLHRLHPPRQRLDKRGDRDRGSE
jgi:hypothetical protein